MSDKVKHLTVIEDNDEYGCLDAQMVKDEDGKELYCVWNLTDCPEDAVIYRDLVSASQWIDAVRYGMRLAQGGYTSIEVKVTEGEI